MDTFTIRIFRGNSTEGKEVDYIIKPFEGMVVLDAVRQAQQEQDPTIAVRWNCKAAKCGSCGAEINGLPKLMCKTRIEDVLSADNIITVHPLKTFPLIKDLVTDVSWNYNVSVKIPPFTPIETNDKPFVMDQIDVNRMQEFRKCIECYLCQTVCHILRNHNRKDNFFGPRQMVKLANLDMHPYDSIDRRDMFKNESGLGYCNITKCCSEVCPEHIRITDNAIIPLKERVADNYYDPISWLLNLKRNKKSIKLPINSKTKE